MRAAAEDSPVSVCTMVCIRTCTKFFLSLSIAMFSFAITLFCYLARRCRWLVHIFSTLPKPLLKHPRQEHDPESQVVQSESSSEIHVFTIAGRFPYLLAHSPIEWPLTSGFVRLLTPIFQWPAFIFVSH